MNKNNLYDHNVYQKQEYKVRTQLKYIIYFIYMYMWNMLFMINYK